MCACRYKDFVPFLEYQGYLIFFFYFCLFSFYFLFFLFLKTILAIVLNVKLRIPFNIILADVSFLLKSKVKIISYLLTNRIIGESLWSMRCCLAGLFEGKIVIE